MTNQPILSSTPSGEARSLYAHFRPGGCCFKLSNGRTPEDICYFLKHIINNTAKPGLTLIDREVLLEDPDNILDVVLPLINILPDSSFELLVYADDESNSAEVTIYATTLEEFQARMSAVPICRISRNSSPGFNE